MTKEELLELEVMVERMLNNLFNSELLDDEDEDKEIQCIKEMISILQDRISYY